jgi:branched-chain amino acid transport system permease protein
MSTLGGLPQERIREFLGANRLEVVVGLVLLVFALDLIRSLLDGTLPVSRLVTFTWDGLVTGLALGLAGIGLSMTYSILNFANFAHGDVMTVGTFAGWSAVFVFVGLGEFALEQLALLGVGGDIYVSDLGISLGAAPIAVVFGLVAAAAFTAWLSLAIDRTVYRSLRGAGSLMVLIASVGVAFTLRYAVVFFYTPSQQAVTVSPSTVAVGLYEGVPVLSSGTQPLLNGESFVRLPVSVGDGTVGLLQVTAHEIMLIVTTVGLMIGIHVLLQRTRLGKAMRAMADNRDLARARGIPTERVIRWTWLIGGGITGAAGFLITLERGTISFQFGWLLLLLIFAAVILGGIGSIYGAIVGGLIIGLATTVSLVWLPEATLARPAAFFIMIVALLVRPKGLLGGRLVG